MLIGVYKLITVISVFPFFPGPMRGSEKLKGILEFNNGTKSILKRALVLYNVLILFVYWYKGWSYLLFAFLSIFEIVAAVFLFKLTRPKIVTESGTTKLIDVKPINGPGVVSFFWDALFWSLVGKALIPFSWKWAGVYVGIPLSFVLEFIYKPYKKLKGC